MKNISRRIKKNRQEMGKNRRETIKISQEMKKIRQEIKTISQAPAALFPCFYCLPEMAQPKD
jgi:hypothetical protein